MNEKNAPTASRAAWASSLAAAEQGQERSPRLGLNRAIDDVLLDEKSGEPCMGRLDVPGAPGITPQLIRPRLDVGVGQLDPSQHRVDRCVEQRGLVGEVVVDRHCRRSQLVGQGAHLELGRTITVEQTHGGGEDLFGIERWTRPSARARQRRLCWWSPCERRPGHRSAGIAISPDASTDPAPIAADASVPAQR